MLICVFNSTIFVPMFLFFVKGVLVGRWPDKFEESSDFHDRGRTRSKIASGRKDVSAARRASFCTSSPRRSISPVVRRLNLCAVKTNPVEVKVKGNSETKYWKYHTKSIYLKDNNISKHTTHLFESLCFSKLCENTTHVRQTL